MSDHDGDEPSRADDGDRRVDEYLGHIGLDRRPDRSLDGVAAAATGNAVPQAQG